MVVDSIKVAGLGYMCNWLRWFACAVDHKPGVRVLPPPLIIRDDLTDRLRRIGRQMRGGR